MSASAFPETPETHQYCVNDRRGTPVVVSDFPAPDSAAAANQFSWARSQEGDRVVIMVEGELDFESAGAFAGTLAAVGGEGSDVIVDLAGVEFIDAAGLGALVRVHRLFEILGLGLTLRSPSASVARLLALCEVGHLVEDLRTDRRAGPTDGVKIRLVWP